MRELVLAVVAILLGILFEKQNVAFMVSLAFALAASGNFRHEDGERRQEVPPDNVSR